MICRGGNQRLARVPFRTTLTLFVIGLNSTTDPNWSYAK
ncbi:hypothetical protein TYRP_022339, partial [Tyrophagus putrescentiae]